MHTPNKLVDGVDTMMTLTRFYGFPVTNNTPETPTPPGPLVQCPRVDSVKLLKQGNYAPRVPDHGAGVTLTFSESPHGYRLPKPEQFEIKLDDAETGLTPKFMSVKGSVRQMSLNLGDGKRIRQGQKVTVSYRKPEERVVNSCYGGAAYTCTNRYPNGQHLQTWRGDTVEAFTDVPVRNRSIMGGTSRTRVALIPKAVTAQRIHHELTNAPRSAFVTEPETGTADIKMSVVLSRRDDAEVMVTVFTTDGTAEHAARIVDGKDVGNDYEPLSRTVLTFAPGERRKEITIQVKDDDVEDDGETFTVNIDSVSGGEDNAATAYDGRTSVQVTINNHEEPVDGGPTITGIVVAADASNNRVWERGESVVAKMTLSEPVEFNGAPTLIASFNGENHELAFRSGNGTNTFTFSKEVSGSAVTELQIPEGELQTNGGRLRAVGTQLALHLAHPAATFADPSPPFVINLWNLPESHDGTGTVSFDVLMSQNPVKLSSKAMREHVVSLRQGDEVFGPEKAMRLNKPDNDIWEITATLRSKEDLQISIEPKANCNQAGAICTRSRQQLARGVSAVIPGPPKVTIADVAVEEADGEAVFTVSLSRPVTDAEVWMTYTTHDGTAQSGSDYQAKSGRVTFPQGSTEQQVSVTLLNDDTAEEEETFQLTLGAANNAGAWTGISTATATIASSDPVPEVPQGVPPTVTSVTIKLDSSENGSWEEGETVTAKMVLNESVNVTGAPYLGVRLNDENHELTYVSGSGTNTLTFAKNISGNTVTSAAIAAGSVQFNGGTITSSETNVAINPAHPAAQREAVPPPTPFRVSLANLPAEHSGTGTVSFDLIFSEEPRGFSYKVLRDQVIKLTQGSQTFTPQKAKRMNKPNNDLWQITAKLRSKEDLTINFEQRENCDASGAICTPDGRMLSNAVSATILGPPGLAVADARADENADDTVDFAVTLSRASTSTVTVAYATSPGSARAGEDYTTASGTLTFAPGDTEKTVSVPILQDAHDEGEETFTLTLSNPSGGNAYLADAEATGTIENTDAMPQAWLARFGRTVAEQVIEAVEGRFSASRTAGVEMTLAGQRIGASGAGPENTEAGERQEASSRLAAMTRWLQGTETKDESRGAGYRSRSLTPREILTGSSFALTGEAKAGGTVSLWGRGAVSRFDGREGDLSLDGEVVSAMLGADWARERWTAGLLVSRSVGDGGYRSPEVAGTVESSLTGLFPYGRYAASDRVTVWGIAGYGAGTLTLKPEDGKAIRTDMDLMMGAVGLRGVAVKAPDGGGIELSIKTDAMAVRTSSEKVEGLEAAEADVTRLRLALEGTWRGLTLGTGTLAPTAEIGLRHDGGDAETGFGLDLGGGLAWSDPESGLSAEFRGRGLLTHESKGFRDRGLSGSFAWAPGRGSGRGPTLTLTQTMGASAAGGADALLGQRHLGGLAANDNGSGDGNDLANRRLELRMGYGFSVLEDRFTMTPELGLGLSNGHREYTLGWRLGLVGGGTNAFEVRIEAIRREAANDNARPEHGAGFRVTARW